MMDINNFEEWTDLYKEIVNWEIKLSDINDSTMIEILMTQKSEANCYLQSLFQIIIPDG